MSEIIIPVGVRIAKFKELTPEAQRLLMKIIDNHYFATKPDCSISDYRDGMIELLETGEACIEHVRGGVAIVLTRPQEFLI